MRPEGWIFMLVSWFFIAWLMAYSYLKLLQKPRRKSRK